MTRQLRYLLTVLVHTLLLFNNVYAQSLQVQASNNDQFTPAKIIQDYLLSEGVSIKKIAYTGNPLSIGYFKGGSAALGVDSGIVMSTGYVASSGIVSGIEKSGKDFASWDNESIASFPDLAQLTQGSLQNITLLEITFVPFADTLSFRYSFASEEYPEFSCDDYNDVFGFFIEGPGYDQPRNIALIPGTQLPVTINTLHPPNPLIPGCDTLNFHLYVDNLHSSRQPTFDGFTKVFKAVAKVVPCQEYTIRLGLADVRDKIYDSAVFLEAKSFGTSPSLTLSGSGILAEGCAPGFLKVDYPSPSKKDHLLDLKLIGTAVSSDYQLKPSLEKIPGGTSSLTAQLVALPDGLNEGIELLQFEYRKDQCRTDTLSISITDNPLTNILTNPDTLLCRSMLDTLSLHAVIKTVVPNHLVQYQWRSPLFLSCTDCPQPLVWPSQTGTVFLNLKDNFGCTSSDSIQIEVIDQLSKPIPKCIKNADGSMQVEWAPVNGATEYAIKVENQAWEKVNGILQHRFFPAPQDSSTHVQLQALYGTLDCDSEIATLTCKSCPIPPVLDTILLDQPSCFGKNDGKVQILMTGSGASVKFSIGNLTSIDGHFSQLSAGKYTLKISTQDETCPLSIEQELQLNQPTPLNFTITSTDVSCIGANDGSLKVFPSGGTPPYDFSLNNQAWTRDSIFFGLSEGSYSAILRDQKNCVAVNEIGAKIKSSEDFCVYFATVFSPNGDKVNDVFFPQGDQSVEIERILIFDRWGNQLFSNESPKIGQPDDGWDGTFQGKSCSQGVYVWYAIIQLPNGQERLLKGDVTLLR
jgi:gliding motility-associated-like protein